MEAPIADLGVYGDMDTEGSFRPSDMKAMKNPKWAEKVRGMFERVPFDINLYFYNAPDAKTKLVHAFQGLSLPGSDTRKSEVDLRDTGDTSRYAGRIDSYRVKPIIGELPENEKSAINVLLMTNEGDGRMAMTPWMVGHRLVHAIFYGTQGTGGTMRSTEAAQVFSEYSRMVSRLSNFLKVSPPGMFPQFEKGAPVWSDEVLTFNEIAKVFGTTRAARMGNHINTGEWLVDIAVQWLVRGRVILKRPDVCEKGLSPPLPPIEETALFLKAKAYYKKNSWNWEARDAGKFADSLIKTHHDEPDPASGFYTKDHVVAIDPKTDMAVASLSNATAERVEEFRQRGYRIEPFDGATALKRDQKTYAAYVKRRNKYIESYKAWLDAGYLYAPGENGTKTDKLHIVIDQIEAEMSKVLTNLFQSVRGKFFVL